MCNIYYDKDKVFKTDAKLIGRKLKKYNIDGFTYVRKKQGVVYKIYVKNAIDWMIKNKYMDTDFWELDY